MKVVGLDLSLTGTGLAVVARGELHAETVRVPARLKDVDRLEHIIAAVRLWVGTADLAVLEGPAYATRGQSGHHERAGLWWSVKLVLGRAGVPVAVPSPMQIKQYATGSGKAGKSEMALAAGRRFGQDVELSTEDEVDAAWAATLGADWLGVPLVPMPQTHRDVIDRITWPTIERNHP